MTVTPLARIRDQGGRLPAGPLAAIILKDAAIAYATRAETDERHSRTPNPGMSYVACLTGIHQNTLYNVLNRGRETVTLDLADKYCCATGRHLRELYPWLYTTEQVEADIQEEKAALRRAQYESCRKARARLKAGRA